MAGSTARRSSYFRGTWPPAIVVPYDYPNAAGAGKVWPVHIVRRPGTPGACTLDTESEASAFVVRHRAAAGGCCSWA